MTEALIKVLPESIQTPRQNLFSRVINTLRRPEEKPVVVSQFTRERQAQITTANGGLITVQHAHHFDDGWVSVSFTPSGRIPGEEKAVLRPGEKKTINVGGTTLEIDHYPISPEEEA